MADNPSKTEENKEIDRYEKIVDRAHKEVEWVSSTYKRVFWGLSIVFTAGTILAVIFIGRTTSEVKDRLNQEIDIVERQVKSQIDEEFGTEKIQKLVEETAKKFTEEKVKNFVNEAIHPLQEEMQNNVDSANFEVQKLKDLFSVYVAADQAMAGSKNAYIKVKSFAAEGKPDIGIAAKARLVEIERYLDMYREAPSFYSGLSVTKNGVKTSLDEISLDEIVNLMLEKPTLGDDYRRTCMAHIKKKPKKEIFEKALIVFASDSLPTCAAFCGVLSDISDEKARFLDFDGWTKICQEQLRKQ